MSPMVWSGGVIWRFAATDANSAFQGLVFTWIGVATVPPLWFLMAARYARVRSIERRPALALALFVPSLLTLLALATKAGIDPQVVRAEQPRVAEVPFDSAHKLMATWNRRSTEGGDDELVLSVKGAPDVVLNRYASDVGP